MQGSKVLARLEIKGCVEIPTGEEDAGNIVRLNEDGKIDPDFISIVGQDHNDLSNIGTNTHAQIDTHIADVTKHRQINDSGSSSTDLWSANKINTELTNKVSTSTLGQNNGVATLDNSGKLTSTQIPVSLVGALNYTGTWNASTNSPALATGVGTKGNYYYVSTNGTTTLDGISDWKAGDFAVYNGAAWQKIDNTDSVVSVAGKTGTVTLDNTDVGLGNVENFEIASQIEAEDGTAADKYMTPERTAQAIAALAGGGGGSVAWGAITGSIEDQSDLQTEFSLLAPLASPIFTGIPEAPTASDGVASNQLATTSFVANAIFPLATLISPSFSGTPTAPTATEGTNTTQIATTAYVVAGFVAAARAISTSGLASGGGDLSIDRTIDVPVASQVEAEAGLDNSKAMTALRVAQAIAALSPGGGDYDPAAVAITGGTIEGITSLALEKGVSTADNPFLITEEWSDISEEFTAQRITITNTYSAVGSWSSLAELGSYKVGFRNIGRGYGLTLGVDGSGHSISHLYCDGSNQGVGFQMAYNNGSHLDYFWCGTYSSVMRFCQSSDMVFGWSAYNTAVHGVNSTYIDAGFKRTGTSELKLIGDGTGTAYGAIQTLYSRFGDGDPEGSVSAPQGAIFQRRDGGAGTTLYVKESGSGSTGWVAK